LTLEQLFVAGEEGRSLDVNGIQYNDGLAVGEVEQRGPGGTASPLVRLPWLPFPEAVAGKPQELPDYAHCEAACEASVRGNHDRECIDFKT
jgi:hypothetical protein